MPNNGNPISQAAASNLFAVAEELPSPAWTATEGGDWLWSNALWTRMTGLSAEESRGRGWQQALDPVDTVLFDAAWRRAPAEGGLDLEHRLQDIQGRGKPQWFSTHASQLSGIGADKPIWLGVCTNIDRIKQLERREVANHHHTTSLIAMARHVTRRTALTTRDLDEYILHVDSRLDVLARVHALSRQRPEGGLSIESLVNDALLAHGTQEGEQVEVSGPDLALPGRSGEVFGLVVNELAMNAVKHGALANGHGRLVVRWRVEAGASKLLRFEWLETGVSVPQVPPTHAGYGTALIEAILPKETGATASFGFGQRGICCTIELPI